MSVAGQIAGRNARAIIIGDDSPLRQSVRQAMREIDLTVIAEEAEGGQGVSLILHYKPDLVVLDATMRGIDGLTALHRIHTALPSTKVVLLSAISDPELGVLALRRGAMGFLHREEVSTASLTRTLRGVLGGEVACSRKLVANIVGELRRLPDDGIGIRPVRSTLTPREWEVLDYLCLGWGTARIAEELVLSTDTVRSHIKNLMRKLGTSSRSEAVALASRERAPAASDGADGRPRA